MFSKVYSFHFLNFIYRSIISNQQKVKVGVIFMCLFLEDGGWKQLKDILFHAISKEPT